MLGFAILKGVLPLTKEEIIGAIKETMPEKFWELNPIQYSTGENVAKNDIVRSKDELYRIKNIEKRGYEYTITLIDTDTKLEEKKYDVSDLIFMTNFPSIEGGKYRKHKRTYKRKNKRANKSRNRKSRRR